MVWPIPIHDPNEHEPICDDAWNDAAAREFVRRTIEESDAAFNPHAWWPLHPEDAYGQERGSHRGMYNGAAGTVWGLHHLAQSTGVSLEHDYVSAIAACEQAYRADPWETGECVPSYFMGTTGIMAARYAVTGDARILPALDEEIRKNVGNKTREVFWGSSGCALAALVIREATGTARFDEALREIQAEYWTSWPSGGEYPWLWLQDMYGKEQRYVGAGHGAFGNLAPFIRARDLLAADMREELHERIVALLETYALHDGHATNWISLVLPPTGNRMQWCHGAPGIIMALASYPSDDPRIEDLLRRGGEAIWQAGPLKKGPTFCHGTAGNGYALLRLFQRTGDRTWLERAQRFAVHAMRQVRAWRLQFGMPSFSLWSGEIGVALFVDGVLRRDPRVLALDTL